MRDSGCIILMLICFGIAGILLEHQYHKDIRIIKEQLNTIQLQTANTGWMTDDWKKGK